MPVEQNIAIVGAQDRYRRRHSSRRSRTRRRRCYRHGEPIWSPGQRGSTLHTSRCRVGMAGRGHGDRRRPQRLPKCSAHWRASIDRELAGCGCNSKDIAAGRPRHRSVDSVLVDFALVDDLQHRDREPEEQRGRAIALSYDITFTYIHTRTQTLAQRHGPGSESRRLSEDVGISHHRRYHQDAAKARRGICSRRRGMGSLGSWTWCLLKRTLAVYEQILYTYMCVRVCVCVCE